MNVLFAPHNIGALQFYANVHNDIFVDVTRKEWCIDGMWQFDEPKKES